MTGKLCAFVVCFVLLLVPVPARAVASNIAGNWNFVLNTPGGDRNVNATFALDGTKVTGKWGEDVDVDGTFADGKLELAFPVTSAETGERNMLTIKGTLDGDVLTGTWAWGMYDGALKATRAQ
jgi:hypothetical protein